MANDQDILNYIREDVKEIKRSIEALRQRDQEFMLKTECASMAGKCDERLKTFVTKTEFGPVKYIVFSLVMVILAQVVRMVVAGGTP